MLELTLLTLSEVLELTLLTSANWFFSTFSGKKSVRSVSSNTILMYFTVIFNRGCATQLLFVCSNTVQILIFKLLRSSSFQKKVFWPPVFIRNLRPVSILSFPIVWHLPNKLPNFRVIPILTMFAHPAFRAVAVNREFPVIIVSRTAPAFSSVQAMRFLDIFLVFARIFCLALMSPV